jgi:hypothetical protein
LIIETRSFYAVDLKDFSSYRGVVLFACGHWSFGLLRFWNALFVRTVWEKTSPNAALLHAFASRPAARPRTSRLGSVPTREIHGDFYNRGKNEGGKESGAGRSVASGSLHFSNSVGADE